MKKAALWITGYCVILISCVCCLGHLERCIMWPVAPHKGDGSFSDVSRRAGPLAFPGYTISFEPFDLDKPHKAVYRFSGLSRINHCCEIYFAIPDKEGPFTSGPFWPHGVQQSLRASYKIELSDSGGKRIALSEGGMWDATPGHWMGAHRLYHIGRSDWYFYPDTGELYTIRLTYMPDPALKNFKGFVSLECMRSM